MKYLLGRYLSGLSVFCLALTAMAGDSLYWTFDGHLTEAVSGKLATKIGEPVFNQGVKGSGLTFAGDSAVSFPGEDVQFENFTLSAWVRSNENKLQGRIFEKGASNSIWLYATQGLVVGGFYDAQKVKYMDVTSVTELLDEKWHFVAVTFDGKALKIFVDGALENTVRVPAGTKPNLNKEPFVIGSKFNGFAHDNLVGALDELRMDQSALTEEELLALLKSGQSPR